MHARLLDLGSCICRLRASQEIHDPMQHYLSPFVAAAASREPNLTVSIEHDTVTVAHTRQSLAHQPATTLRTSHPEQRYRVWSTADREILLPEHTADHVIVRTPGHICLVAEDVRVAATIGIRIVRQLVMRGAEVRGGRCVHAAAVDLDGRGLLIAGHSGSGKTTVLTQLLEEHGAHPVSNDRTALIATDTGRWHAMGVPLAARFTPEGISGSPSLTVALHRFEPSRGRQLVDGKIELTPWEVSTLFQRTSLSGTEVTHLVLLTRTPQASVGNADGPVVRHHLDFGTEDAFADDWLNLRPHLRAALPTPTHHSQLWERLADTVPVLRLSWTDPTELPRIAATASQWVQQ